MDSRAELEQRARAGDAAAFGTLIRVLDHHLRGVVWAVVRSTHATDDVMQLAYEKAFRSIDQFDGRSAFKTWLHSICYRTAIDHVRYESHRRHADIDDVGDLGTATDAAAHAIARVEVERALGLLDDDERAMIMLTAGLGYSYDQVAEIVGQPRGTVAAKVSRARKRIAPRLTGGTQ